MADIIVDTSKLDGYAQRLGFVNARITSLDFRLDALYSRAGLLDLWNLIQADLLTSYSWRLQRCQSYLQQTASDFAFTEQLLLSEDPANFKGVVVGGTIITEGAAHDPNRDYRSDILKELAHATKPYATAGVLSMFSPVTGLLYITSGIACGNTPSFTDPSRTPSSSASAEWLGYEVSEGSPGITAWLGKAHADAENEWGHAGVNAYMGKVEAKTKADLAFMNTTTSKEYDGEKWEEKTVTQYVNAELGVGGSLSVLAVDAEAGVGTDMLGAEVSAEGSAGNAKVDAGGKFSVTDDGVDAYLKGEAMVSAVEGEVSGSINILGIEIKGNIGGYAGALGVEGKIGFEDNKFVMRGGVAALLGVSGGVEIGFNDEGWDNFVDFITFWD